MPGGGIKVTPDQLHGMSGSVARGSSDIDGTLRGLQGQIAPLVGGEWAGQASQQFDAMYQQWQRSAQQLTQALQGISRLLANAGTAYAQAEMAIAGSFRQ
jgi:WXG100 family type VII secretion target